MRRREFLRSLGAGAGLGLIARKTRAAAPELASSAAQAIAELEAWARAQQATLSAVVLDAEDNRELATCSAELALNPASNAKILTLATALELLGPDHAFHSSLHGRVVDGALSELVLRSDGHPEFGMGELEQLVARLNELNPSAVAGDVWVDHSAFDSSWLPPGYEQHPNDWAAYRAPVSAVALEGNVVTLHVQASSENSAARVWFTPAGFIANSSGSVGTTAANTKENVRYSLRETGSDLGAVLGGSVPAGAKEQSYTRRIATPELAPGRALLEQLRARGVRVSGTVRSGGANVEAELASVTSRPLAQIAHALGKHSDNFVAEMLLKAVGAKASGAAGSSAAGARAVLDFLSAIGASATDTVIRNGSGLYDANRVSARTLARTLFAAAGSPRVAPELMACLSIGGVDGTLRHRFQSLAASRSLRAKTGTLADAIALSGYLLRPGAAPPLVFAIVLNGVQRKTAAARQRIDAAVTQIAHAL